MNINSVYKTLPQFVRAHAQGAHTSDPMNPPPTSPTVTSSFEENSNLQNVANASTAVNGVIGCLTPVVQTSYNNPVDLSPPPISFKSPLPEMKEKGKEFEHPYDNYDGPLYHDITPRESRRYQFWDSDILTNALLGEHLRGCWSGRQYDLINEIMDFSENVSRWSYGTEYEALTGLRYWKVNPEGSRSLFKEWVELFMKTNYLALAPLEVQEAFNSLPEDQKREAANLHNPELKISVGKAAVSKHHDSPYFLPVPQVLGKRKRALDAGDDDVGADRDHVKRQAVAAPGESPEATPMRHKMSAATPRTNAPRRSARQAARQTPHIAAHPAVPAIVAQPVPTPILIAPQGPAVLQVPHAVHPLPAVPITQNAVQGVKGVPPPAHNGVPGNAPRGMPAQAQAPEITQAPPYGPGRPVPPAAPAVPVYRPTLRMSSSGVERFPWTQVRQQMWLSKPNNNTLPPEAVRNTYNPAHTGTPECIEIRNLGPLPVTIIEVLTYFPLHTCWRAVAWRLSEAGWDPSQIVEYIYWARSITDVNAIKRPTIHKQMDRARNWASSQATPVSITYTMGNIAPVNGLGGYSADLLDFPIFNLGDNVVHHPTFQDAGVLTQAIALARATNDTTTTLQGLATFVATHGIVDQHTHRRNPDVRIEDADALDRCKVTINQYYRAAVGNQK